MDVDLGMLFRCKPMPERIGAEVEEFPPVRTDLTESWGQKDNCEVSQLTACGPLEALLSKWEEARVLKFVWLEGDLKLAVSCVRLQRLSLLPQVVLLWATAVSNWRCLRIPRWCWLTSYNWIQKLFYCTYKYLLHIYIETTRAHCTAHTHINEQFNM